LSELKSLGFILLHSYTPFALFSDTFASQKGQKRRKEKNKGRLMQPMLLSFNGRIEKGKNRTRTPPSGERSGSHRDSMIMPGDFFSLSF
jgi:hypothetical protein